MRYAYRVVNWMWENLYEADTLQDAEHWRAVHQPSNEPYAIVVMSYLCPE